MGESSCRPCKRQGRLGRRCRHDGGRRAPPDYEPTIGSGSPPISPRKRAHLHSKARDGDVARLSAFFDEGREGQGTGEESAAEERQASRRGRTAYQRRPSCGEVSSGSCRQDAARGRFRPFRSHRGRGVAADRPRRSPPVLPPERPPQSSCRAGARHRHRGRSIRPQRSQLRIESRPGPPRQRSKPAPPRSRSAPRPPFSTSSPGPALIRSGPPRPSR